MDFEEIENLEEEQLNDMYNEVVDFGDDAHLAGCCCTNGVSTDVAYVHWACWSWCRRLRSECEGWYSERGGVYMVCGSSC